MYRFMKYFGSLSLLKPPAIALYSPGIWVGMWPLTNILSFGGFIRCLEGVAGSLGCSRGVPGVF